MKPTTEQNNALDMAISGVNCKITAYAGAGKTSTLKLIASALSNKKGMYLAFNKAIATEAQSKFSSNVECKTFHSLAYSNVPRWLTAKLKLPRTMRHVLAHRFDLTPFNLPVSKLKQRTEHDISRTFSANDQANVLIKAIGYFCRSLSKTIELVHVENTLPDWIELSAKSEMAKLLFSHVQFYWADILNPEGVFKIEHDNYLKYWALMNPIIKADFILFDEAQDADPIMLDVLSKQKTQVIYVGDRHQQIYAFRGAVNAMQSLQIAETRLSQSFRFGQEIADIANIILKNVLGETVKLNGLDSVQSSVCSILPEDADAFLFRTNAAALAQLVSLSDMGISSKFEADTATLKTQVEDAQNLQSGKPAKLGSIFEGFSNWEEVLLYVKELPSSDISPIVNLIEKVEAKKLIYALDRSNPHDFDCVISTAHKSKGLEFSKVIIGDDFFWNENAKSGEEIISEDEARLLYVACTRAQNQLDISSLSKLFIAIN
jgi:hypothetical protein